MACERKLLESEATTGFFVLLGTKGKKETLEWCMKANLIASRYECPRCKKEMSFQERKGTVDGYEWRCRSQSKDNPHDVVRSVRKGIWFSESKLGITIILRLTRYWFGKSMNAFVVNDLKVNKNTVLNWYMFCREVCMLACVKESAKLGGVGEIVEIDESLFGKRKYGKGRRVNGKWVFGGVQRESKKLLRVTELIHSGFAKHEATGILFLDIAKAFDKIWHDGLLIKLIRLDFPPPDQVHS
ncbi:mitotic-spindle organizing protein 2A [Trichonephila clavipes]|nr:mitotic-spindle organizing protein 2A [Trichonephila clavipes]